MPACEPEIPAMPTLCEGIARKSEAFPEGTLFGPKRFAKHGPRPPSGAPLKGSVPKGGWKRRMRGHRSDDLHGARHTPAVRIASGTNSSAQPSLFAASRQGASVLSGSGTKASVPLPCTVRRHSFCVFIPLDTALSASPSRSTAARQIFAVFIGRGPRQRALLQAATARRQSSGLPVGRAGALGRWSWLPELGRPRLRVQHGSVLSTRRPSALSRRRGRSRGPRLLGCCRRRSER